MNLLSPRYSDVFLKGEKGEARWSQKTQVRTATTCKRGKEGNLSTASSVKGKKGGRFGKKSGDVPLWGRFSERGPIKKVLILGRTGGVPAGGTLKTPFKRLKKGGLRH